jgi:cytochrome c peroxidase
MLKRLLWTLFFLVVLAALFPASNLVLGPKNKGAISDLRPGDPTFAAPAQTLERKCAGCHVPGADLPFYAMLPAAGGFIQEDVDRGTYLLDLKSSFLPADAPVGEVVLAKIEHVVRRGMMPPLRYRLMHWGSGLGKRERQDLLVWIGKVRSDNYASPIATRAMRTELFQPIAPVEVPESELPALGRKLFNDRILSGDRSLSCASCHAPESGGSDRLPTSRGIGGREGPFNTLSLYNAASNFRLNWDGSAADFKEQADGHIADPDVMGAQWTEIEKRLLRDRTYRKTFYRLFPDNVTRENVLEALAAYQALLVTPNCRFDRFLLGDGRIVSDQEKRGFEIFQKKGCATCHVGVNLGGQSFERMGLRAEYFAGRGEIKEADNGRFNVTGNEADRHKFRVPSLRNVVLTWPYFHDGSVATLREAVEVMAACQTEEAMTPDEVDLVVDFLETLTGELGGKPLE